MSREIFGKSTGSALTGLLTHYTSRTASTRAGVPPLDQRHGRAVEHSGERRRYRRGDRGLSEARRDQGRRIWKRHPWSARNSSDHQRAVLVLWGGLQRQ